jgi:transposase
MFNEIDKNIYKINKNHNIESNISLKKIKEEYLTQYGKEISLTKINKIIKNNLNYKFRKISIKTKELEKINYKSMSFLYIKILLRALKLNLKLIFVDESKPELKNDNFKTWISSSDFYHYGPEANSKRNIIMVVGIDELYHYEINKSNTNSTIFKNILIDLFSKIKKEQQKEYILIMDNLACHRTKEIKDLLKKYNIKTLFTVPYESYFNPIELSFRYLKNKIYKNIFYDINKLKIKVEDIDESNEFEKLLSQNFAETLEIYMEYIKNNNNINLNNK